MNRAQLRIIAELARDPKTWERFKLRAAQEALTEELQKATSDYWRRRAATFDAVGSPSGAETALACRNAARFYAENAPWWIAETIDDVIGEVDRDVA